MAGLTAAWELTRGDWQRRFDRVTVYQRGWLLGGKGASTRGSNGEILEHGLHVWPGYYDNAFRVIRECYAELDRAASDPECPIRTWRDAFFPASDVGVFEHDDGRTDAWLARFRTNGLVPGAAAQPDSDLNDLIQRALGLIVTALRSGGDRARAR